MANYLVTGGCGFIGSQLTKQLIATGHAVTIVDDLSNGTIIHPKARFIQQDITEFDALDDLLFEMDGCFHLAAIPTVIMDIDDWVNVHAINLEASLNVFKLAIAAGNVPVVYASSCGVYGNTDSLPLHENQYIQPLCSYGCDKLSMELNAYFLAHDYQLPSVGLRLFNVYGPYQQASSPYSGVITQFITQLLNNKPITVFGDGEQTRDFVFVDDVVDNLIYAMTTLKNGAHVVNLCTAKPISINQLVNLLSKLLNQECTKHYEPARTSDVNASYGCQKKMHSFGFEIKTELTDGLKKTIDYFLAEQSKPIISNKHAYYRPSLMKKNHTLMQLLRHTIQHEELYLCYQPLINVNTQKIIGFEALIRWNSPQLGLILPADFIPMAEKTGQIIPISDWVLKTACQEAITWQKTHPGLRLSLNVSVKQLHDNQGRVNNHLLLSIQEALALTGLNPNLLELEITESILMQMNDETLSYVTQIKNLGVRLSCDDFGVGYSSYTRLLKLPLDTIKIDQSLIKEMASNVINTTIIIRGIIFIAQQLNLDTIAEGVETKEQFEVLKNLGCTMIQGNYFSHAVRASNVGSMPLSFD